MKKNICIENVNREGIEGDRGNRRGKLNLVLKREEKKKIIRLGRRTGERTRYVSLKHDRSISRVMHA